MEDLVPQDAIPRGAEVVLKIEYDKNAYETQIKGRSEEIFLKSFFTVIEGGEGVVLSVSGEEKFEALLAAVAGLDLEKRSVVTRHALDLKDEDPEDIFRLDERGGDWEDLDSASRVLEILGKALFFVETEGGISPELKEKRRLLSLTSRKTQKFISMADSRYCQSDFDGSWFFMLDTVNGELLFGPGGAVVDPKSNKGLLTDNKTNVTGEFGRVPVFAVAPLGMMPETGKDGSMKYSKDGREEVKLLTVTAFLSVYQRALRENNDNADEARKFLEVAEVYYNNHSIRDLLTNNGDPESRTFQEKPLVWARDNRDRISALWKFMEWAGGHADTAACITGGNKGRSHIFGYPTGLAAEIKRLAEMPGSRFEVYDPTVGADGKSLLPQTLFSYMDSRTTAETRLYLGRMRQEWMGELKSGHTGFLAMATDGNKRELKAALGPEFEEVDGAKIEEVAVALQDLEKHFLTDPDGGTKQNKAASLSDFVAKVKKMVVDDKSKNPVISDALKEMEKAYDKCKNADGSSLERHERREALYDTVANLLSKVLNVDEESEGLFKNITRGIISNGDKIEHVYAMLRLGSAAMKNGKARDYNFRALDLARDGGLILPGAVWTVKSEAVGDWSPALLETIILDPSKARKLTGEKSTGSAGRKDRGGRETWGTFAKAFGHAVGDEPDDSCVDFIVSGFDKLIVKSKKGGNFDEDVNAALKDINGARDLARMVAGGGERGTREAVVAIEGLLQKNGTFYRKLAPQLAKFLGEWHKTIDKKSDGSVLKMRGALNEVIVGVAVLVTSNGRDDYGNRLKKALGKNQIGEDGAGRGWLGAGGTDEERTENQKIFYRFRRQYGAQQWEMRIHEIEGYCRIKGTEVFANQGICFVEKIKMLNAVMGQEGTTIISPEKVQMVAESCQTSSVPVTISEIYKPSIEKFSANIKAGYTVAMLKSEFGIDVGAGRDSLTSDERAVCDFICLGRRADSEEVGELKKNNIKFGDIPRVLGVYIGQVEDEAVIPLGVRGIMSRIKSIYGKDPREGILEPRNATTTAGAKKAGWQSDGFDGGTRIHGSPQQQKFGRDDPMGELRDKNKYSKDDKTAKFSTSPAVMEAKALRNNRTDKRARQRARDKILQKLSPSLPSGLNEEAGRKSINLLVMWGCLPGGREDTEKGLKEAKLSENLKEYGEKEEGLVRVDEGGVPVPVSDIKSVFNTLKELPLEEEEMLVLRILAEARMGERQKTDGKEEAPPKGIANGRMVVESGMRTSFLHR
jgi:hypothetical protein